MKHIFLALFLAAPVMLLSAEKRPNIVFILADDLGWSDTTLYGHTKFYETPNIERLAKRGMTFNQAYAVSPLCSPTRASILTGLHPARHGITSAVCHLPELKLTASVDPTGQPRSKTTPCRSATRLDTRFLTLAKSLKDAGYVTGHFGKWHLGPEPYSPLQHGFDVDVPHTATAGPPGGYFGWRTETMEPASPEEHIEDRMAAEAIAFIARNKDRPFFVNYWQFSVHSPFQAKRPLVEKYRKRVDPKSPQRSPTYAAMVETCDTAIGKLIDTIDRLELAANTIIIFTSDNGGNMYSKVDGTPPTSNAPLRGGKATLWEGGIRVPCVIVWPGFVAPESRSDTMIQSCDFYPTLIELLGLPPRDDQSFDGVSVVPALKGQPQDRGPIFTFFPHALPVPAGLPPAIAVHLGDWKLFRLFHRGADSAHDYRLFNLASDIGEKNDLAEQRIGRVKALDKLMEQFLVATRAVVPQPNPNYEPPIPTRK